MPDRDTGSALVRPFPAVGPLMEEAYQDLRFVEQSDGLGLERTVRSNGSTAEMPRPWLPATCGSTALRAEVWAWLDAVVDWLNTEYVWLVDDQIPGCWPRHPHLVHELGVVADQRRRANAALDSDLLEEWHRYCLPALFERLHARTQGCCETGHRDPPTTARVSRYRSAAEQDRRDGWYRGDLDSIPEPHATPHPSPRSNPRLVIADGFAVDPRTGEIP